MRFRLLAVLALVAAGACDTSGEVFVRPGVAPAVPDPTSPVTPVEPTQPTRPTEPCVQTDSKAYTILRWSKVGEGFEYSFPVACGRTDLGLATPLTIVGPDNQPVEGQVTITSISDGGAGPLRATVSFVPSQPGLHTLKWTTFPRPDLWVQAVSEPPVQRIVREFRDRMDLCMNGLFLTPSGFTVCAPVTEGLRVYDPSGALVETVPALPREVAVVGNTLWSTPGGGALIPLEARHISDAGVRLIGSVSIAPLAHGPITETTFERGFVRVTIGDGGMEQTTLRTPFRTDSDLAILDGPNVLTWPGCSARPGCSTTPLECPPVETCFTEPRIWGGLYIGITADTLWVFRFTDLEVGRLTMLERPVDLSRTINLASREIETAAAPLRNRSPARRVTELPHVVVQTTAFPAARKDEVMIPVRQGNAVRFVRVSTQGEVVSVTPFAVAAQLADPFMVEFLLLPPAL